MSTDPSCPTSPEPKRTKIEETEQEEKNVEMETATTTEVAEEPPVPLRKEDVEPKPSTGSEMDPSSARTSILTSRTSDTVGEEVSISINISEAKDEPTKDEPDGVSRSATTITEHSLENSDEERTMVEQLPPVQGSQVQREEEEAPIPVITNQPLPTPARNPDRRESAAGDGCSNCCIRTSQ
ncbi:hypothetical protein L5515_005912 [Caenorhabditis briggsae]|uniref:Uncharacterized protein n=1 Tax=Caenorhabditis briggsae TaxID=6238 RepID=A0AAE9JIT7_CAEBR|nr:hypothetical protein L5515_005912 [Caenorhabditis briggsae]